jgi:predicted N-acyltransferase
LVFYANAKPVGIAYCQIIHISNREINSKALSKKLGHLVPQNLIDAIDLNIMICGNAFATGENGYLFLPEYQEDEVNCIGHSLDEINVIEKNEGNKISLTLIKEFWPASFEKSDAFKQFNYANISIDVNMVVKLKPEWKTFDDYLAAMNSKFRTKAKNVYKKSDSIKCIHFNLAQLQKCKESIDELYNSLVDKANFSFGRLNAQTLINMKETLGDHLIFKGYYIDDKLIGFSTATSFDDVLDGNYIGLDYDVNEEFRVYQRMLYDFIRYAIENNLREVRIGRTAEEIKSGVGAMPVEMQFYGKHRNRLTNAILKPIVSKLEPSKFELRKPFKAEYYS